MGTFFTLDYGDCIQTILHPVSNEVETCYTQIYDRMETISHGGCVLESEGTRLILIDPFQYLLCALQAILLTSEILFIYIVD